MTSLFSNTWMCINCGREACEECFEIISRLTGPTSAQSQSPNSPAPPRSQKERQALANPFFLSCSRKNEHGVQTFTPVTRFVKSELDEAVAEMERLTLDEGGEAPSMSGGHVSMDTGAQQLQPIPASQMDSLFDERVYDDGICALIRDPIPPRVSSTPQGEQLIPTYPVPRYTAESLTEEVFVKQWAKGIPLVVEGLADRLMVSWTPEYFMTKYGNQPCIVVECQTDSNKKVTVREFFDPFGKYEGRTECWKLKVCVMFHN